MDLFAKAVKSGIAKGVAIGQQQLQQHLARQRDAGNDDTNGYYGAPSSGSNTNSYSPVPQQQQQQHQQYAATYNGVPPPLPPRQYQPPQPQPQPNYHSQPAPQNLPVNYNYESAAPSRPEYSYGSIMPPPPPSYIPPTSSNGATYSQYTAPPSVQPLGTSAYGENRNSLNDNSQFQQQSHEITAGFRPAAETPAPIVDGRYGQQSTQRLYARANGDGYYIGDPTTHETSSQSQQLGESRTYAAPPVIVATYETQPQPIVQQEHATHSAPPAIETRPSALPRAQIEENQKPDNNASSSVEQQMSSLSLSAPSKIPEAETRSHQNKKRTQPPPILEDGPGKEVVRFCPQHRLVDYPLYWHYLADLPDSPICTRCYADYIESTPLADKFERRLAGPDTVLSCHFRYARVQNILWPAALKSHSVESLKAFLSNRLGVPNCKGRATTSGADGIKYYGMKNDDINGFIACEACFEDHIAGTAFESQFEPYKHEQKENRWTCDASIQYVPKALATFSKRNDWRAFVEGASRRFKAPACEGKETSRADSGSWYTTRQKLDNFQVCEACYMDKVELDPFCAEYEQIPGSTNVDEYIEYLRQRWTCSLPSSSLPMMFALEVAETNEDFAAFYKSASAIVKLVPCTKYGVIRGNWWTVKGGCDDFDLCEACHEGIMKPYGLDRFLEPKQRGPEETVICDFCTAAPRFNEYLNKFVETLDRGIFSCFADHIRTFAGVKACPGRDSADKTKWWGYGEALFCEHCYLAYVRHTPLSDHMPLQGAYDERAQICQIWSPRMRTMWQAACDAGAPGSAASDEELIKFRAFGTRRLEVWLQTVPRITFIRGMKDIRMMQAMQQGQLSLMYKGMNSMSVLSGTDDGNLHGNSSIGWYETENGATGAQMFNNMQQGMADANRGDEWMEIFRLELIWKEVE